MQDIALGTEEVRIGNKRLSLHTLSDTDDLPGTVSADTRLKSYPPTGATAVCRSLLPWDYSLAVTISTTNICFG